MRQSEIGIITILSGRYAAKKWIDEVNESVVLSEALLESKKFYVIKCPRIYLIYNTSNILRKLKRNALFFILQKWPITVNELMGKEKNVWLSTNFC